MACAIVEHLLRLGNAPDGGPGQPPVSRDERPGGHRNRLGRDADDHHRTLGPQHSQIPVVVMRRRDGVDEQVETAGQFLEGGFVPGGFERLGPEADAVDAMVGQHLDLVFTDRPGIRFDCEFVAGFERQPAVDTG